MKGMLFVASEIKVPLENQNIKYDWIFTYYNDWLGLPLNI